MYFALMNTQTKGKGILNGLIDVVSSGIQ